MRLPKSFKRLLKRVHQLVFFDTFTLALRTVPVNSELYFWVREFMIHLPGKIGLAYRSRFYNRYFKSSGGLPVIQVGVCIEHPQGLEVGDRVSFNRNCWINAVGGLKIGSDSAFGPNVVVHTANHNYQDPDTPFVQQGWTYKPVIIEEDVWLAASVIVVPGTLVGRGAVVAAGAVVRGNVEPFALMAGVPARKIGTRGTRQAAAVRGSLT